MKILSPSLVACLSVALLHAFSAISAPSKGDIMSNYAEQALNRAEHRDDLATQWKHGESLIVGGEKRVKLNEKRIKRIEGNIAEAQDSLKKANEEITKGKADIFFGKELMVESEQEFVKEFPGQSLAPKK
jgi:septal ring factor EnvC (AmiA/AmiB activator)